jgi:hypothetical protein
MPINALDLTSRPPRSPRVRLGGYTILARMLDKGRASIVGKEGEYHFNCPTDQLFLSYTGISADALRKELEKDKSDSEILEWINAHATNKRVPAEIAAWSLWTEQRAPSDLDSREFFNELQSKAAAHRKDVTGWFDLLDVDDYVSFGGKG